MNLPLFEKYKDSFAKISLTVIVLLPNYSFVPSFALTTICNN